MWVHILLLLWLRVYLTLSLLSVFMVHGYYRREALHYIICIVTNVEWLGRSYRQMNQSLSRRWDIVVLLRNYGSVKCVLWGEQIFLLLGSVTCCLPTSVWSDTKPADASCSHFNTSVTDLVTGWFHFIFILKSNFTWHLLISHDLLDGELLCCIMVCKIVNWKVVWK